MSHINIHKTAEENEITVIPPLSILDENRPANPVNEIVETIPAMAVRLNAKIVMKSSNNGYNAHVIAYSKD